VVYPDGPSPETRTGLAGVVEASREWLGAWEDFRFVVDEYRELYSERVLVLVRYTGRGKTSGIDLGELGMQGAQLFRVREGRVTRFVRYIDRARAFADLGLSPERKAAGAPD
jgi:hypothetical protein